MFNAIIYTCGGWQRGTSSNRYNHTQASLDLARRKRSSMSATEFIGAVAVIPRSVEEKDVRLVAQRCISIVTLLREALQRAVFLPEAAVFVFLFTLYPYGLPTVVVNVSVHWMDARGVSALAVSVH
ncbi:hypothetical protein Tcan_18295 [Toxocara canis]|uniref:Uncharacterized protein n=1 Tax=Toxocara canis TaxID=6265 RepID=A0A0B2VF45_TOXCA|nr:hypothetical protein Tcan_18295 [Toxocara canis]